MNAHQKRHETIKNYIKALDPRNYFRVLYKDRMFVIKYYNRTERVAMLEEQLQEAKENFEDMGEYVEYVLNEVLKPFSECNFVIFQIGDNDTQFVQFWTGDRKLEHDFPFVSGNNHLPYMKPTRKLLEELGFSFNEGSIQPMQYTYNLHVPKDVDDYSTLNADFGTNIEMAAEYTLKVFTNIFKKDVEEITILIGTHPSKLEKRIKLGIELAKHLLLRVKNKLT